MKSFRKKDVALELEKCLGREKPVEMAEEGGLGLSSSRSSCLGGRIPSRGSGWSECEGWQRIEEASGVPGSWSPGAPQTSSLNFLFVPRSECAKVTRGQ